MDKITNNIFNNTNKNLSKDKVNISSSDKVATIIKSGNNDRVVDLNNAKLLSTNLVKSAPIDSDKVAKLKAAISAGNYPLDLDKVSDALMQAYREMKSWLSLIVVISMNQFKKIYSILNKLEELDKSKFNVSNFKDLNNELKEHLDNYIENKEKIACNLSIEDKKKLVDLISKIEFLETKISPKANLINSFSESIA